MERKDWLYVALHLIIILMLLVAFVELGSVDERLKKMESREDAFMEYEFIKEAKQLVDDPAFYERASPDTIKFYEKYAQLYPLIERLYDEAQALTVGRLAAHVAICGKERYARYLVDRLYRGEALYLGR